MATYKRKTNSTRRHIKEALVRLLKNDRFDALTINQIIEEAEITRSTFYRYYEDKYGLLEEIENEVIKKINEQRENFLTSLEDIGAIDEQSILSLFNSLQDYAEIIQILLSEHGDSSFEMKLRNEISKRVKMMESHISISPLRKAFMLDIQLSILIRTFQFWTDNQTENEEIARIVRDIILHGMQYTLLSKD
ncbi:TetR/AcrR family transcriptional regulator [Staphylococcus pettenkoferi]|uniref:TetR/AcrR family transcriptional regulator n=1 Tax=Staphylococcus pettenkoferi TaxID=170573 RepID=A0A9Q4H2U9_9STAP|nr:TetR/AcrR family transcriptional regulator [Staphylococcus pettenkoferi]MCY1568739.1 TetR/AcrR family transcriptional regulator [Staphylococcus pettenkoferi]MCY1577153.1 TetR/AcrR family transcriptional regulator [Staphylococcus pettenkoferi]MCY1595498.1 TetR/AcrR family transcriptional regulator [Staphylococcus pettenkoferi]MCY1617585.1 TetR/AcrR family transcriptional regulator [Staphylococcus pettenkoferi]